MNIMEILNADVISVVKWCDKDFHQPVICDIETAEDMAIISRQMTKLANQYSYLSSILSYLKFYVRKAKSEKDAELANSLIDKKETINNALEAVKTKYNMLSRQITIRQDIMKELSMAM